MNELNKELQHRGPDTRCIKAELAERLQAALKAEGPDNGRELKAMSWTILPCTTTSTRYEK
ncbi:hypothetical protein FD755_021717 [Muntiacus reevesi]|uniref:SAP domain-containing protein n=1 Tax=Muntiacus reevesi TaxID=9886 RepID=A0A5N3W3W7_MUNRE|nr:hypothetical protein FD755_021717 [Muntiacus reevesi]